MKKIKERVKKFIGWIWAECKDWKTMIILLCVIAVMYSPVWGGYLIFALFKWRWYFMAASAYMAFWAGPFTPFFPICIAITLFIKKLIRHKK